MTYYQCKSCQNKAPMPRDHNILSQEMLHVNNRGFLTLILMKRLLTNLKVQGRHLKDLEPFLNQVRKNSKHADFFTALPKKLYQMYIRKICIDHNWQMIDQLRDLLFKIIYKLLPFLPKLALSNYRVQKLKPEKLTTIHWKKSQRSLRGIWISPIIIVLIAPYLVIIIIPSTA